MAQSVAVIGAGLMGSGISQVAAQAGHDVVMRDVTDDALTRGRAAIEASFARFVGKGTMSSQDGEQALARITTTTDLDAVAGADIVIEAVYESLDIKRAVFAQLDKICKPGALLATNTSALPVTQIAAATGRPENVVGTHFFSPVPMMKLCELVRGFKTSDDSLARARAFAEGVGKTCIVVSRDISGFVATRLIAALCMEAARLVESGVASADDVDTACRLGLGHAMGPLRTMDLTGIDILADASRNIFDGSGEAQFFPPELLVRMVAAGELGRKTGRGFYTYE
ncbi:MAG: 3-hydroxyacyl-CoA dehydrogenase family protein [Pseudonocardiales bacterium]